MYHKSFQWLDAGKKFCHGAACLCGEFIFIEPLAPVGIEVAHILLFRILYASVEPGRRVVESHAGYSVERSRAEYHIASFGGVVGRRIVGVDISEEVGAYCEPRLYVDFQIGAQLVAGVVGVVYHARIVDISERHVVAYALAPSGEGYIMVLHHRGVAVYVVVPVGVGIYGGIAAGVVAPFVDFAL